MSLYEIVGYVVVIICTAIVISFVVYHLISHAIGVYLFATKTTKGFILFLRHKKEIMKYIKKNI